MESPIVIEHRDSLTYLLYEAAELEHAICVQYLFAGFSLKKSVEEGVDERQLKAISRWHRIINEIASQEMLHLALVNNLLSAIGAAPRVGRPNLPNQGHHYPPGVQFALVPFGETALRHFLYLERPEGINLSDAEGFASLREAEPLMSPLDIVPRPQDFSTVGHLYRSIEDGFRRLVDRHGEDWVFIGDERAQATPASFLWPELVAVTDLDSAVAAIEEIVEQGEGPRGQWRDAHYGRLLEVLGEYLTLRREDPSFDPSRPVMNANVRVPVDAPAAVLIGDPDTAQVLDCFNVGYEILLYLLARFFAHGHETDEQLQTFTDAAVGLMVEVIDPLGSHITTLPVGPEHPGRTAGPSFEVFYGSGYLLPHTWQAWVVIHERLCELSAFMRRSVHSEVVDLADTVDELSLQLAAQMPRLVDRRIRAPKSWSRP